jgi:hypothetical protein
MMECGDDLETKIVDLYDAGGDEPELIDLIDEVVAMLPASSIRPLSFAPPPRKPFLDVVPGQHLLA